MELIVKCSKCNAELYADIGSIGYFMVNPCQDCLEEAKEEATKKGYDEGYEQGREEVIA